LVDERVLQQNTNAARPSPASELASVVMFVRNEKDIRG
jgi:hypothetical protein